MRQILRLVLSLTIICAIATALLAYVHEATRLPRERIEKKLQSLALQEVLPTFETSEKHSFLANKSPQVKAFRASLKGKPVGIAIQGGTMKGFSGEIKLMAGFDNHGKIVRIKVLDHKETPGIGTKVTDRIRKRTLVEFLSGKVWEGIVPNPFLDQFEGIDENSCSSAKIGDRGINAISGATITSAAVLDALYKICSTYKLYNEGKR